MNERRRGIFLAFASCIFWAGVIILGKYILQEVTPWEFTTFFFMCGAAWYTCYFLAKREWGAFQLSKMVLIAGVTVGMLDGVATLSAFSALKILHPAVRSFLGHMTEVLSTFLGILILKEHVSFRKIAGLAVAVSGVVIMMVRPDPLLVKGFVLMFVAAVFYSLNALAVRYFTKVKGVHPVYLAYRRSLVLTVIMFTVAFVLFDSRLPLGRQWGLFIVLGFIGPFMQYMCYFSALKYLDVGRVSVIRLSYSIFVLIGSYFVFAQIPSLRQIIGGFVILSGILLAIFEKRQLPAISAAATPESTEASVDEIGVGVM